MRKNRKEKEKEEEDDKELSYAKSFREKETREERERESLITSKNRVCSIGVEIVALRNEVSRLLDFQRRGLLVVSLLERGRRHWLNSVSPSCDPNGDRDGRGGGTETDEWSVGGREGWNYFSCLSGTPVVIWIHPVSGACLEFPATRRKWLKEPLVTSFRRYYASFAFPTCPVPDLFPSCSISFHPDEW